jgi:hypothetical protein
MSIGALAREGSMKSIVLTSLALVALTGSIARSQSITRTAAATPLRVFVRSDSRLWFEGSSNVRDWRCDATTLDASIDVDESDVRSGDALTAARLRHVQVRVPAHALSCGRGQMDRIMYKALHVDDEPDCRQIVGRFDIVPGGVSGHELVMQGTLRVAGRERAVRLPVSVERLSDGALRATGALPILMTDYGITPPSAFFGVLRTENRIVVKFDLVIDHPDAVASAAAGER